MYINCTCIHTHIILQNNLLDLEPSPPPRSHSKLTYFLNFSLLSSFSLILFASNNGILWV